MGNGPGGRFPSTQNRLFAGRDRDYGHRPVEYYRLEELGVSIFTSITANSRLNGESFPVNPARSVLSRPPPQTWNASRAGRSTTLPISNLPLPPRLKLAVNYSCHAKLDEGFGPYSGLATPGYHDYSLNCGRTEDEALGCTWELVRRGKVGRSKTTPPPNRQKALQLIELKLGEPPQRQ